MVEWFKIKEDEYLETPSLIFYPDRIESNIDEMIRMIGDVQRLRPHVKTHKCAEIIQMHQDKGISKFKCATIAEAEMLGIAGCPDVLLAYQPVGANIDRFIELIREFPETSFSCICDDLGNANELSLTGVKNNIEIDVFVDIDDGMHRTGVEPDYVGQELCREIEEWDGLNLAGLHVYDGHLRDQSLAEREQKVNSDFQKVLTFIDELTDIGVQIKTIVAGGSPTFPVHARNPNVEASPGTTILWDKGYGTSLDGLEGFQYAALLLTRIISKPGPDLICLDIGHKAISAEHQKPPLIFGIDNFKLVGHSEEHMVLEVDDSAKYQVGDIFYAVPHHICPTVALHENALVVKDNVVSDHWEIVARKRKITI